MLNLYGCELMGAVHGSDNTLHLCSITDLPKMHPRRVLLDIYLKDVTAAFD